MTLTSAQYDVLKQKLDAMKRRIQEELKHRDPAQFAHIEIGDASIDDTLQHEAMSQYLHQHAEWEAVQRASARMAENIASVKNVAKQSLSHGWKWSRQQSAVFVVRANSKQMIAVCI